MDRALVYSVIAAMLGLALIIVPVHLALTALTAQTSEAETQPRLALESLGLEREDRAYKSPKPSVSEDLEVLSISFFVAMSIYLFTRRRRPKRFLTWPPTAPPL